MMGPDFWHMGGYAAFVWPAYGATLLGLIALGVMSYRNLRALEKRLADLKTKTRK